jgi:acetate kinase
MAGGMKILVLNGGSSSFKCWFQDVPDGALAPEANAARWTARVEWKTSESPENLLGPLLQSLWQGEKKAIDSPTEIHVVGHRIVHGGPKYRESVLVTPEVRAGIAEQAEFAPAHNRLQLAAIQTVDRVIGTDVPQLAVFDTGFHATLQPAAYIYPGPYAWLEQGIRRYGFHGISVQYSTRRATELLHVDPSSSRLIICHLGNGASVTAVANGKSVDTSMGFTPLEGLMMGTRSGSVDPSILVHLIRRHGYTANQIDEILNRKSGLLGVSGISGDMREILDAIDKGDERARLAYNIYAHRLTREIGAMLAVLGGMDAIVFTGGIGENCAPLREAVCAQFGFLGLKLHTAKNARPELDQNIAAADSAVQVLVVRADEDWEIARECQRFTATNSASSRRSAQPVRA